MSKSKEAYDSTQKKIIQQTVVTDEEGNKKQETNVFRLSQEPPYIKVYLSDILYYNDMPRSLNPILQIFFKYMNWDNTLVINSSLKKRMAGEINLSVASIDKALTQFVKAQLLFREDKGIYLFNPYLFGKGKWDNVQEIRMQVTYNLEGRKFSDILIKRNDEEIQ